MSSKKYKLFSASASDDGPKPCAFFLSEAGCKNGSKCKFLHADGAAAKATTSSSAVPPRSVSSGSDVSSEESEDDRDRYEDDGGDPFLPRGERRPTPKKSPKLPRPKAPTPQKPTPQHQPAAAEEVEKKNKKKRKKHSADANSGNIFANPREVIQKGAPAPNYTPAKGHQAATPVTSAAPSPNGAASRNTPNTSESSAPPRKKSKKQRNTKQQQQSAAPSSFRDLYSKLPIAAFSLPSEVAPKMEDDGNGPAPPSPQHEDAPSDLEGPTKRPHRLAHLPLPTATPDHLKWKGTVEATRRHARYDGSFDFDKYRDLEESTGTGTAADWVKARPYGPWAASNPAAIAIDCEMCETRDPVTGATDHKALCRISVVNAVNPDEVLLDTLVKPAWPVRDYRTRINGIKREDLEAVQFTLRHAQAFMMALCSDQTVVAGHAVHNDLVALRMEHHCNADSSFLFGVKDEENSTPSLKDLAWATLQREMPDTHDSVNDARVALSCLEYYLEKDGAVDPIPRTFPSKRRSSSGGGFSNGSDVLFVHRVPRICKPDHISKMFVSHTSIQPKDVPDLQFSGDTGKTKVAFASTAHANLAYETLTGEEKLDKTGRPQKRVYLRNGDYVYVRKMKKPRKKD